MRAKPIAKPIEVTVNIKPVKLSELTPAQRALHRKFWAKLIAEVKNGEDVIKRRALPGDNALDPVHDSGDEP